MLRVLRVLLLRLSYKKGSSFLIKYQHSLILFQHLITFKYCFSFRNMWILCFYPFSLLLVWIRLLYKNLANDQVRHLSLILSLLCQQTTKFINNILCQPFYPFSFQLFIWKIIFIFVTPIFNIIYNILSIFNFNFQKNQISNY